MIGELSSILLTAIGSVGGTGGLAGFFLWRYNKRMKALEVQLAEANVSKARIEGKSDEWHIWKEQCEALSELNHKLTERNEKLVQMNADKEDRHQQDIKDWEERFTNQTTYLRGVQRDLIAANEREKKLLQRIGVLMRRIQYLLMWICKDSNCDHGQPPRERLKGKQYKDQKHGTDGENDSTYIEMGGGTEHGGECASSEGDI